MLHKSCFCCCALLARGTYSTTRIRQTFCAIIFVFEMWPLDFLCVSEFVSIYHLVTRFWSWSSFEMDFIVEYAENIRDKKKPLKSWRHIFSRTLTDSSFGKSRTSVLLTYQMVMMMMIAIKSSKAFGLQQFTIAHITSWSTTSVK